MRELLPEVAEALKNLSSPDEIMKVFNEAYRNIHYPPIQAYHTLLMCHAVKSRRNDLLDKLLELGYNPNYAHTYSAELPLHTAIITEQIDVIEKLLSRGISVHTESSVDFKESGSNFSEQYIVTTAEAACMVDNVNILKLLQNLYNPLETRHKFSWLHYAVLNSASRCLNYLLTEGKQFAGDINAIPDNFQSKRGLTPLMMAAGEGSEMVRRLLEAGANPSVRSNRGMSTAMHEAVRHSETIALGFIHEDVRKTVQLLIEAGCDVNALDTDKSTPLSLLVTQVSCLVRGVPNANYPYNHDDHRRIVLETTEYLLRFGADPNLSVPSCLATILRCFTSFILLLRARNCSPIIINQHDEVNYSDNYSNTVHLGSTCSALELSRDLILVLLKNGAKLVLNEMGQSLGALVLENFVDVLQMKEMVTFQYFQLNGIPVPQLVWKWWIKMIDLYLDIIRIFILAGDGFDNNMISNYNVTHISDSTKAAVFECLQHLRVAKLYDLKKFLSNEITLIEFSAIIRSPCSLRDMCGEVVAKSMGVRCLTSLDRLNIPTFLHRYIIGLSLSNS